MSADHEDSSSSPNQQRHLPGGEISPYFGVVDSRPMDVGGSLKMQDVFINAGTKHLHGGARLFVLHLPTPSIFKATAVLRNDNCSSFDYILLLLCTWNAG